MSLFVIPLYFLFYIVLDYNMECANNQASFQMHSLSTYGVYTCVVCNLRNIKKNSLLNSFKKEKPVLLSTR